MSDVKKARRGRFLLVGSLAESLLNFRGVLIADLVASGFEVHVAAPAADSDVNMRERLLLVGAIPHDIFIERAGRNPLRDLRTLMQLVTLMLKVKPSYMLAYTIKPVIFGNLAARICRVQHRFALITGLGYAFQNTGQRKVVYRIVRTLYRLALSGVHHVFFQNPDDQQLFRNLGLIDARASHSVVSGSGVDMGHYAIAPLPSGDVFLMIARLLGDKGVREYAGAARQIRARYPQARFAIVGWIDENPDAVTQEELDAWVAEGTLEYWGRLADVRPAIARCSVYVLPSYREGTPRTVLEAMAMGRPIITTDAPGCRETVVDGDNGYLVPIKSVDALSAAMENFINQPALVARMGARAYTMVEQKYDVCKVNTAMFEQMGIQ